MLINHIIVIGASAGGPRILRELFNGMPRLNASVVLVQHMPKFINQSLCRTLDEVTDMHVKIARDGMDLEPGVVYVAPSEHHLSFMDNRLIHLHQGEKVHFVRPSVDVTMKSLNRQPNALLMGVILTGMGKDGADGIRHVKRLGGITLAQDEQSSIIYGMPKVAAATGDVDFIGTPIEIQKKLIDICGKC